MCGEIRIPRDSYACGETRYLGKHDTRGKRITMTPALCKCSFMNRELAIQVKTVFPLDYKPAAVTITSRCTANGHINHEAILNTPCILTLWAIATYE